MVTSSPVLVVPVLVVAFIIALPSLRVQNPERAPVCGRKRRRPLDVVPDLDLLAKAHEVRDEIPTVLKRVHDVRERTRMREPERVAQLMNTSQIFDCIPEERG
jgi:hypothetical protein